MEDMPMGITEIIALLSFGLVCFEIGYRIRKDVSGHKKSRH